MKKIIKDSVIILIINVIIATILYSISSFKIGNRADIIEFMSIVYFFILLFFIFIILYIILRYIFYLDDKVIYLVTNVLIFTLILFNHCQNWRNPYLIICTPVYFITQYLFFVNAKKKQ
jgi:hypothetical protein